MHSGKDEQRPTLHQKKHWLHLCAIYETLRACGSASLEGLESSYKCTMLYSNSEPLASRHWSCQTPHLERDALEPSLAGPEKQQYVIVNPNRKNNQPQQASNVPCSSNNFPSSSVGSTVGCIMVTMQYCKVESTACSPHLRILVMSFTHRTVLQMSGNITRCWLCHLLHICDKKFVCVLNELPKSCSTSSTLL